MDEKDHPVLRRVAESISDGEEVDWNSAASADRGLEPALRRFRIIEAIAAAHRAVTPAREIRPTPVVDSLEATSTCDLETGPASGAGTADGLSGAVGAPAGSGARGGSAPPTRWGPLEIRALIGEGGFGEVYRAFDSTLKQEVALKLRRPARAGGGGGREARGDASGGAGSERGRERSGGAAADERFLAEAQRLARVRHRNVLTVHGAARHEGRVGLWTDLLRGETLEEVIKERGTFGDHEAALIGIDLCHALAAVHAELLVHRDVKTANVMREEGGRIVLMDFGSVTERPGGTGADPGWEPLSGTPLFMAPEQILSGLPATPATDIYSLGVILYRLVTRRFPIEAKSWSELVDQHRGAAVLPLRDARPNLSAAFVQVVERALDPDPKRRFASAGAMEKALAAAIGLPASSHTERDEESRRLEGGAGQEELRKQADEAEKSRAAETDKKRKLRLRLAWGSLAAALALAAAGWLLLRPSGSGAHPLTAEASLYRLGESGEERLLLGSRVQPGDRLFLEISGREPMHVYVLNEDQVGSVFVLFPAGLELQNPLSPGISHRLPGARDGRQMTWEITSAGEKERLLVVASLHPLADLERDIARLPRAEEGRQAGYAQLSRESFEALRGIGGLAPAETAVPPGSGGQLSSLVQSLSAPAAGERGVWIWQTELENPAQ